MSDVIVGDVEVDGTACDVSVTSGRIDRIAAAGTLRDADFVIGGRGGALIPGLHDHHIHLASLAAERRSLRVTALFDVEVRRLDAALPPGAWIRATGYHESIAGVIDRARLDDLLPTRPIRVQHRGGAMWIINSVGLAGSGIISETGELMGGDALLRSSTSADDLDLGATASALARFGVTGVSDLTPTDDADDLELLARAARADDFPLNVVVTGGPGVIGVVPDGVTIGPVKVLLADHDLPSFDLLVDHFHRAHGAGRPVAVHCVTRVALVLALAAWRETGAREGDRVEHGAVIPAELFADLRGLGLTVVTQPSFVRDRGDRYVVDVEAEDVASLWRCGSLLDAGILVGGSTDAPFGDPDPWNAIAAAVERTTAGGRTVGADDRIDARRALELFLSGPDSPGGPPRRVAVGEVADLCLLHAPLAAVLAAPSSTWVAATVARGRVWT